MHDTCTINILYRYFSTYIHTSILTSLTGKHSLSPISSPRPNWWPMRSNQDFSSQAAKVSSWRRVEPTSWTIHNDVD